MDRDKLNKAAEEHFNLISESAELSSNGFYVFGGDDVKDAFKQGTDWLMQQPLSERLTDEEKEKLTPANRYILGTIFGADLFNQPTAI